MRTRRPTHLCPLALRWVSRPGASTSKNAAWAERCGCTLLRAGIGAAELRSGPLIPP
jgi:hypothetical protein